jgi:uncharacterized metal-binding protein
MNGNAHRGAALAIQVAAGTAMHEHPWQIVAGIPFAVAFSAGPTSPDIDDTRTWKKLDKWVPDEWLGFGGPLQHRGLMHWVGWPVIGALLIRAFMAGSPVAFLAWAVVIGVGSHVASDVMFGQRGYGTQRGVPLLLWTCHVGVGRKSDGVLQHLVLWPVCLALIWWSVGMPGG